MRGSTKILYHVMWQPFYVFFFVLIFVNFELWQCIFVNLLFLFGMECVLFAIHLTCFCNHTLDKLQSLTCVISATVFFFQSQHISGQGMFCNHLVFFTKLQPHQAKTKLVTPSFFTSFCNRNDICYKGCNHTEIWFAINYILVCNCLSFCNCSTSVVANTLLRMLQSPVFLDQVAT
jgi:hypothetical protein